MDLPRTGECVYLIGHPDRGMTVGLTSEHWCNQPPDRVVGDPLSERIVHVPCSWFDECGVLQAAWFDNRMLCYGTDSCNHRDAK